MSLERLCAEDLDTIQRRGTYRALRTLDGPQTTRTVIDGKEVLLFAGSNYLDLAHHPEVVEASVRAARSHGCAAGGSRLISGNLALHDRLEEEIAAHLGTETALVFATGYMANVGLIPALVGPEDVIVSDALNHASIIDGCRLSRAQVRIVPHADLDRLESELAAASRRARRVLLVADGVYSMDGDVAPLAGMAKLAQRFGAVFVVDDAHGTGTLGRYGRGTVELLSVADGVAAIVGTLGKALGSFGAFVAGSRALRDLLVNVARSFIFSCALAPPQVEAARAALALVVREPWRRERLQANAARLRQQLAGRGISTAPSTTHIVPVVLGSNEATMRACGDLLARGFFAQGIRHPSVPDGTARLRLTPMATHEDDEIDALADAVVEVCR